MITLLLGWAPLGIAATLNAVIAFAQYSVGRPGLAFVFAMYSLACVGFIIDLRS